jgi:hypothetical protein
VHATCIAFRSAAITHGTLYSALPSLPSSEPSPLFLSLSLSFLYLTPMDCLMTRPRCRQRGALRAALFLLPRAFYRHPLLIAVVPHRLRRESIYHHQHHHKPPPSTITTSPPCTEEIRSCMPAGFPRLNPRLTALISRSRLALLAMLENASGFDAATNSRAKLVSGTL